MEIERLPLGQSHADRNRAAQFKWKGKPPGLPPEMAMEFMAKLKARRTVRKPTGGGKLGPAFVSNEGSKKHCQLNPIWAADAFEGRWVDVPDDAVITELNRAGRTMIWPYTADRGTDHPHTEIRSCVPKTLSVDNATESPKLAE